MFQRAKREESDIHFEFEKTEQWNLNPDKVEVDSSGGKKILVDSESPYGPTLQKSVESLNEADYSTIVTRIEFSGLSQKTEVQLVYEQINEDGGYAWESDRLSPQITSDSLSWAVYHYQIKQNEKPGILKSYLWSPNGESLVVRKVDVWFR